MDLAKRKVIAFVFLNIYDENIIEKREGGGGRSFSMAMTSYVFV